MERLATFAEVYSSGYSMKWRLCSDLRMLQARPTKAVHSFFVAETSVFTSSIFATRSHISTRSAKGQGFLSQMVMQVSPVSLVMPLLILWAWTIRSFSHFWSDKSYKLMNSNFQRLFVIFPHFSYFFRSSLGRRTQMCEAVRPDVATGFLVEQRWWFDMICMVLRWGFMIQLLQIHSEHVSRLLLLDDLADHLRFKFWRWWVFHPKKCNINCIKFSRRWAWRDQCQEQGFLSLGDKVCLYVICSEVVNLVLWQFEIPKFLALVFSSPTRANQSGGTEGLPALWTNLHFWVVSICRTLLVTSPGCLGSICGAQGVNWPKKGIDGLGQKQLPE